MVVLRVFIFVLGRDRVVRATFFRMLFITSAEFILPNFVPRAYSVSNALFPAIFHSIFTLFLKTRLLHELNAKYQRVSLHAYPVNDRDPGVYDTHEYVPSTEVRSIYPAFSLHAYPERELVAVSSTFFISTHHIVSMKKFPVIFFGFASVSR